MYYTESKGAKKDSNTIKYGPFDDIKELNKEPLKLHFVHESPFVEVYINYDN